MARASRSYCEGIAISIRTAAVGDRRSDKEVQPGFSHQLLGATSGLPQAFSGHMTYYLWGPPKGHNEIIIAYGIPLDTLESLFGEVTETAEIFHPLALKMDSRLRVYVCRLSQEIAAERLARIQTL
jgi:hypothetical protein